MSKRHATLSDTQRPALDEVHWRAAAEEGARVAAKHWEVPLANITEIALSDVEDGHYLFKVIYTDGHGQRRTAALHMPKGARYTSPLEMSALCA
ncbi:MAG: hypothetical protein EPO09_09880 [Aquabacterium sp.]|uniref:hypothetical protein n=1 Tax=Aquabacterium sp. TaxID=1872578 RepID=UPI0012284008|nr:hypothetical protein [Aquabacterium sp.]TAK94366.1 MAG: hypothetical protein EPO09_09880 [Aquabacterium sp.]